MSTCTTYASALSSLGTITSEGRDARSLISAADIAEYCVGQFDRITGRDTDIDGDFLTRDDGAVLRLYLEDVCDAEGMRITGYDYRIINAPDVDPSLFGLVASWGADAVMEIGDLDPLMKQIAGWATETPRQ